MSRTPPLQCLFCTHANPAGAKFCNKCGVQINLRPCGHCRAINDRAALQCGRCGAPLGLAATAARAAQPPPATTGRELETATADGGMDASAGNSSDGAAPPAFNSHAAADAGRLAGRADDGYEDEDGEARPSGASAVENARRTAADIDENAAISAALNALPRMAVARTTPPEDHGIHPRFKPEQMGLSAPGSALSPGMQPTGSRSGRQWVFGIAALLVFGAVGLASFHSYYGLPEPLAVKLSAIPGFGQGADSRQGASPRADRGFNQAINQPVNPPVNPPVSQPVNPAVNRSSASIPSTNSSVNPPLGASIPPVANPPSPAQTAAARRDTPASGTGLVLQGTAAIRPAEPPPRTVAKTVPATDEARRAQAPVPAGAVTTTAARPPPADAAASTAKPATAGPAAKECAPAVAALGLCG